MELMLSFYGKQDLDLDEFVIVGNNLFINGVAEKDDGDFICEVETKGNINDKISIKELMKLLWKPNQKIDNNNSSSFLEWFSLMWLIRTKITQNGSPIKWLSYRGHKSSPLIRPISLSLKVFISPLA